jgi:hypothetical protein
LALVMGVRNGRDEARVAVGDDAALRLAPEIEAAKIADG